jgi:osmotically-inducible protein OsmY
LNAIRTLALFVVSVAACGRTDPAIQTTVDSQLASDPVTSALSVDIAVTRGVVRLEGQVDSLEERRRALDIARGASGVRDVVDGMYPSDANVAAAVKKALAADPLVGRIPIAVRAQHGHVELVSDQTSKEDRVRAVEIASGVDGVTHVEDLMR